MLVNNGKGGVLEREPDTLNAAAGPGYVIFTGFVDNVGDYVEAFDPLILPSQREGMGRIRLDAIEHGLPVTATYIGALPATSGDGENDPLADHESPDQVGAAILWLQADAAPRANMSRRGREVAKQHTLQFIADKYFALYESVRGRSG